MQLYKVLLIAGLLFTRRLPHSSDLRLHLDDDYEDVVISLFHYLFPVRGVSSLISFSCSLAELGFVLVSSYFDSDKGKPNELENEPSSDAVISKLLVKSYSHLLDNGYFAVELAGLCLCPVIWAFMRCGQKTSVGRAGVEWGCCYLSCQPLAQDCAIPLGQQGWLERSCLMVIIDVSQLQVRESEFFAQKACLSHHLWDC